MGWMGPVNWNFQFNGQFTGHSFQIGRGIGQAACPHARNEPRLGQILWKGKEKVFYGSCATRTVVEHSSSILYDATLVS